MLNNGYFMQPSAIYEDNFDFKCTAVTFKKGLTPDQLRVVCERLTRHGNNALSLAAELGVEDTYNIIIDHPWILLRVFQHDMQSLPILPSIYKANHHFMNVLVSLYGEKLNRVFLNHDFESTHAMMSTLFRIVGGEMNYLSQLPRALFSEDNPRCTINKTEIMQALIHSPNISLSQLVHSTQHLSPHEFATIIQNRQGPPLTYCDNRELLTRFCQELIPTPDMWINYSQYKRTLVQTTYAARCFHATDYWFIAYMRYQHHYLYFDSRQDVIVHLKRISHSLHRVFVIYVFMPVSIVSMGMGWADLLTGRANNICKSVIAPSDVCQTQTLGGSFKGDEKLFLFVVLACLMSILAKIFIELDKNPHWRSMNYNFSKEANRFLYRSINTLHLILRICPGEVSVPFDLLTRCEDSIFRLQGLDNCSAHQKAALLNSIYEEMKNELSVSGGPRPNQPLTSKLLEKKRPIVYREKTYDVSFWSVAAHKRDSEAFDLATLQDKKTVSTTTETYLLAQPHMLGTHPI